MGYRYYTPEECVGLVGKEVVPVNEEGTWEIETVRISIGSLVSFAELRLSSPLRDMKGVSPSGLLNHYKFADGSPCGKEEE